MKFFLNEMGSGQMINVDPNIMLNYIALGDQKFVLENIRG